MAHFLYPNFNPLQMMGQSGNCEVTVLSYALGTTLGVQSSYQMITAQATWNYGSTRRSCSSNSGKFDTSASLRILQYDCACEGAGHVSKGHIGERQRQTQRTSIAAIFPFINWFSVAARSSLSRVRCIGLRALSMSDNICMGIIVRVSCARSSMAARWLITSFLHHHAHESAFERISTKTGSTLSFQPASHYQVHLVPSSSH